MVYRSHSDGFAALKRTYERERLGYICNLGSLNRERDAVMPAVPIPSTSASFVHRNLMKSCVAC